MHTMRKFRKRSQKEKTPSVLCVDDDADLTRLLKVRLQQCKVTVTRACSGRDGLRLARSHRPSAIISDLGMAGGDGEYLIRRLQSRPSTASIPVLILSGLDDPTRINVAYRMGATSVLKKSDPFDVLVEELKRVLGDIHEEMPGQEESTPQRRGLQSGNKRLRIDGFHSVSNRVQ